MPKLAKTWNVLELLNWGSQYLSEKGFEHSRLNAERLLGHALNLNRVDLYLNYERPLTAEELTRFKELIQRRLQHEPLQYILGETEFYSLNFRVNRNVLIPRPETEILVETVLKICREKFNSAKAVTVLEIGAGSGCIAVALAKHLPMARITAIDVSEAALATATENARFHEVAERIQFQVTDFLAAKHLDEFRNRFDIIVSNPPYISESDFANLPPEIREYEPSAALKDGPDGLSCYRQIAAAAPMILNSGGWAAVEVGLGQADAVAKLFAANGLLQIQVVADLNGIERVVFGVNQH